MRCLPGKIAVNYLLSILYLARILSFLRGTIDQSLLLLCCVSRIYQGYLFLQPPRVIIRPHENLEQLNLLWLQVARRAKHQFQLLSSLYLAAVCSTVACTKGFEELLVTPL